MSTYKVLTITQWWSRKKLARKVEEVLVEKNLEGWLIISVSFGINLWLMPTAFITLKKG